MPRPNYEYPVLLNPSEKGYKVLQNHCVGVEALMALALSGSHNLNPYHNTRHELQHVFWSNACAINSRCCLNTGLNTLALASLFHDHNHSGGMYTDDINIDAAVEFVKNNFDESVDIIELIRVTEFTGGKFNCMPVSFQQKCMRDADLMAIYSREGQNLLIGLFEEMGQSIYDMSQEEVEDLLARNSKFLYDAEMFTPFGKLMKDQHLARCLKDFESNVRAKIHYQDSLRQHHE